VNIAHTKLLCFITEKTFSLANGAASTAAKKDNNTIINKTKNINMGEILSVNIKRPKPATTRTAKKGRRKS